MAMDRETRTLLKALVGGQVKLGEGQGRHEALLRKLAEGQARHDGSIAKLAEGQGRHEALLRRLAVGQAMLAEGQAVLAEGQAVLAKEQARTSAELRQLGKRMDNYAKAVVRGFTAGLRRDDGLAAKLEALDARVTALERDRQ